MPKSNSNYRNRSLLASSPPLLATLVLLLLLPPQQQQWSCVQALSPRPPLLLSRRAALSGVGGALLLPTERAMARAEWSIDVKDWKVAKKLDSVTRIKALALLQASYGDPSIADLKVTKVPLGSMAVSSCPHLILAGPLSALEVGVALASP